MNIVILSDYNNINYGYQSNKPITIVNPVDFTKFEVGNLVIKEYFKKENDGSFSYSKETMIIVDIIYNDTVILKLKSIIKLETSYPRITKAHVTNYEEILYYIDNIWKTEGDMNSDKSCDNIILINANMHVYRTNISKGYMFEDNGKLVNAKPVKMVDYKPKWCLV